MISSSALSSPTVGAGTDDRVVPRGPGRTVSGSSVAVQDEPCLSLAAAPVCRRPCIWGQCVAPVGQLVREEAAEVRLSPAGPAPTDRSPGPRPCVDVWEAQTLLLPREARRSATIAVSAGLGGASARAGRTLWSPPQGDLREGGVLTVGPAQRGQDGPWWAAGDPGSSAGPLPRDG